VRKFTTPHAFISTFFQRFLMRGIAVTDLKGWRRGQMNRFPQALPF